jgi:DNA ligase-1
MILRGRTLSTLAELQQIKIESTEHLQSLLDMADKNNWEGLIVRRNVVYEGKRGKNMLKCKTFKDAEYVVLDTEVGPFRVIEDGCEKTIDVMSNIIIEHKGNRVSVGSGWSLSQRVHYYNNPNDIIGKIVTVKYFQESVNKSGEYSLRFPTLKIVHGISRTT